jgi:hypothetical protein
MVKERSPLLAVAHTQVEIALNDTMTCTSRSSPDLLARKSHRPRRGSGCCDAGSAGICGRSAQLPIRRSGLAAKHRCRLGRASSTASGEQRRDDVRQVAEL